MRLIKSVKGVRDTCRYRHDTYLLNRHVPHNGRYYSYVSVRYDQQPVGDYETMAFLSDYTGHPCSWEELTCNHIQNEGEAIKNACDAVSAEYEGGTYDV